MKKLILTCEHGGNQIPEEYRYLFISDLEILQTHRGWDPGALDLGKALGNNLNVPIYFSETSRLLIELNRSHHHPSLFSTFTKDLDKDKKKQVIVDHYLPYRNTVEKYIKDNTSKNHTVIHVSVHSFTPVLNNVERNCDIGLLYDPARNEEKEFCKTWKDLIQSKDEGLRVRFNYPYRGSADGFTSYLRKNFPEKYLGIELEVNQDILKNSMNRIKNTLSYSLQKMVPYEKAT